MKPRVCQSCVFMVHTINPAEQARDDVVTRQTTLFHWVKCEPLIIHGQPCFP